MVEPIETLEGFALTLKNEQVVQTQATAIDPSSEEGWLLLLRNVDGIDEQIGRYRRSEVTRISFTPGPSCYSN